MPPTALVTETAGVKTPSAMVRLVALLAFLQKQFDLLTKYQTDTEAVMISEKQTNIGYFAGTVTHPYQ